MWLHETIVVTPLFEILDPALQGEHAIEIYIVEVVVYFLFAVLTEEFLE